MAETQVPLKEQADKILESIPTNQRCGDHWNEIQIFIREMEYSEDVQKDCKELIKMLQAFVKTKNTIQ